MNAQMFPITFFIEEELNERQVPLEAFLNLVGITERRWKLMQCGETGCLLSECERMAGALGVKAEFLANLNLQYMRWTHDHR